MSASNVTNVTDDTHNDVVMGLDEELKDSKYYYKLNGYDKMYSVNRNAVDLVELFANSLAGDKNACSTPETCLVLNEQPSMSTDYTDHTFRVLTPYHIDFLDRYLKIWENNSADEAYIKEEAVTTKNPAEIFKNPEDLKLLQSHTKWYLSQLDESEQKKCESDEFVKRYHSIMAHMKGLHQTLFGYLGAKGFGQKNYAYIATLMYDHSLEDLKKAIDDVQFKNKIKSWQDKAVAIQNAKSAPLAAKLEEAEREALAKAAELEEKARAMEKEALIMEAKALAAAGLDQYGNEIKQESKADSSSSASASASSSAAAAVDSVDSVVNDETVDDEDDESDLDDDMGAGAGAGAGC